ncbi:endoglucanase 6-like [Solanum verrucosum]|uniref:endoglucanase 6-like n=1 Tax=Solanum verrucosum TaxID=315347 RepID=UPI0020D0DFB7|nr:endoglucanase 6-like [Solanum verrucosum]
MDQDNSQKCHSHTGKNIITHNSYIDLVEPYLPNSPGKELYYSRSAKQSMQFFMSSKAGHNAPVFEKYQQKAKNFMCSCLAKDDRNTQKTPAGLIYMQRWNNMYFVTSAAFLATTYSDYLASAGKYLKCSSGSVSPNELLSFSKSHIKILTLIECYKPVDYILGDNLRATK